MNRNMIFALYVNLETSTIRTGVDDIIVNIRIRRH